MAKDNEVKDKIFDKVYREVRNRTLAEAFLALQDLVGQNEFARRLEIDGGKFSAIVARLREEKSEDPQEVAAA